MRRLSNKGYMLQKTLTYFFLCVSTLWMILTSSGLIVEHHCHHCQEVDVICHHAPHHTHPCCHNEHCDHCANCWSLILQLSQYDIPTDCSKPAPTCHTTAFASSSSLLVEAKEVLPFAILWHIPWVENDSGGRCILLKSCMLLL